MNVTNVLNLNIEEEEKVFRRLFTYQATSDLKGFCHVKLKMDMLLSYTSTSLKWKWKPLLHHMENNFSYLPIYLSVIFSWNTCFLNQGSMLNMFYIDHIHNRFLHPWWPSYHHARIPNTTSCCPNVGPHNTFLISLSPTIALWRHTQQNLPMILQYMK